MKYIVALLALSVAALAAPFGSKSGKEKRVPDVDDEVEDAGYFSAKIDALWDG
ncbi:hypothetical protein F4821DRAFT_255288 [Hypoxylon rubiginosum]|uniref:Uncharacterized protein n=1 Tax=Hypoxylon rubiginosum TaxID=110542 RepID=A0ACC0DFA4_9PEZI|nr:hypothetical protein F4821DRAFT_255288 [Hypoxylon rubiginosum]